MQSEARRTDESPAEEEEKKISQSDNNTEGRVERFDEIPSHFRRSIGLAPSNCGAMLEI